MYSNEQIEFLRARWNTPYGIEVRQAALDTAFDRAEQWPAVLDKWEFPGSPPPLYHDYYVDLRGIDLSGLDLTKADFAYGDVSFGDFSNCKLAGSCFQGGIMDGVSFKGSDLAKSDLLQIYSHNADFSGCNLTDTVLMCARFMGGSLEGSDLTGSMLDNIFIANCNLKGTKLDLSDAGSGWRLVTVRRKS